MDRLTLSRTHSLGFALLALHLLTGPLQAQTSNVQRSSTVDYDAILAQEGYIRPPEVIERAVLAPRHLQVSLTNLSPAGRHFLTTQTLPMPRIEDFGKTHYNLAGWLIDPQAARARTLTTSTTVGLELISWEDGRKVTVQVPNGATVSNPRWSPNGQQVAFFANTPRETTIYVADVSNGRSRQVTRTPLLATHVTAVQWLADGEHVIAVLRPSNSNMMPEDNGVPTPKVRLTQEGENRLRTYFDLIESPHEMQLVEHYSTGQLARINVRNGRITPIGDPAMIRSVNASPDGQLFRVSLLERPFSYIVPVSNFGNTEQVWDAQGRSLTQLASQPLREGISANAGGGNAGGGAQPQRRSVSWRPDGPGLTFMRRDRATGQGQQGQGQEGGPRMDRFYNWLPPFTDESVELVYETENEINAVRYSEDSQILFITETSSDRWQTTFAMVRSDPGTRYTINRTRATGGAQGNNAAAAPAPTPANADQAASGPRGTLMTTNGANQLSVVRLSRDGQHVFLSGSSAQDAEERAAGAAAEETEAPRPVIEKLNFRTGEVTRIFEGNPDFTESVSVVLDQDVEQIVLSRQTRMMVPQSIYRNLVTGEERQLTSNEDFTPVEMRGVQQIAFEARRSDGLEIRVRVTLPPNFREGDRLPAMFWFYPSEYTSFDAYYRTSRNRDGVMNPATPPGPGRYPTFGPSAIQFFTLLGYAVVEPDAPIVGPEGRMNDNYIHDLRNNLSAVIDELDRRGIVDREKLAIGGHSYGGFSTINALAHTPFFKAGIAGASNTNRLTTPLGFQRESRDLWTARETYLSMSGLLHANQITGALLLYHGMQDQNVGTHPSNSERMFAALNGLGKTAALFMYPFEDHGQATQESRLDMWARWSAWLEKYVKNGGAPAAARLTTDSEESRNDGG